jgi:site-specific DNA-methyltransferase (adenine-specific)
LRNGRSIVLYAEDCRIGIPEHLAPGSVDVIVTSPPYNIGIRYAQYHDRRPRSEYLVWMRSVARVCGRVLADRGSFFLNLGGPPKDPWLPWDVAREVGRTLVLQNVIHWVKSIAIDRRAVGRSVAVTQDLALGHYRPVGSNRFLHGAHEYLFHFTHTGDVPLDRLALGVPYQDPSNVARWKGARRGLRCRGNTWFLPYPTIRRRATDRPHPASFPPELAEYCVKLHGVARAHVLLDPFVGIGSTAVAGARFGIATVGFDIDRSYLAEAARRVAAALEQAPTTT